MSSACSAAGLSPRRPTLGSTDTAPDLSYGCQSKYTSQWSERSLSATITVPRWYKCHVATRIAILTVDCRDADLLANFWCRVLGWQVAFRNGPDVTITGDDAPFRIDFMQMPSYRGKAHNKIHLDLVASDTDQQTELDRLLAEGARPMSIGKGEITWHVLADPEGNEFCLLRGEENLTVTEPYQVELPETDLHDAQSTQSNGHAFDTSEPDFVAADFGELATPGSLATDYPVEEYSAVEYSLHADTTAAEPVVSHEPAVQTAHVRHEDAAPELQAGPELRQAPEPTVEPDLVAENEPAVARNAVAVPEVAVTPEVALVPEHVESEHIKNEHTEPELMSGEVEKADEAPFDPEAHIVAEPVSIDDGQLDVELADEAQTEYESVEHHDIHHHDDAHGDDAHGDDAHDGEHTVIEHHEEQLAGVADFKPAPPAEQTEPEYVEPVHVELEQDGGSEPVESVDHSIDEPSAAEHRDSDSASVPEQHIESEVHAAPDQHTSDLAETTLVLHGLDFSAEESSRGDEPVVQHDPDHKHGFGHEHDPDHPSTAAQASDPGRDNAEDHEDTTDHSVSSSAEDESASAEPADDYGDAVSELRAMIRSRMSRIN